MASANVHLAKDSSDLKVGADGWIKISGLRAPSQMFMGF